MKQDNLLPIQDYVSRPESIRNKLSKKCFDDGIDTFFNHKVPFSYSTGKSLAYKFYKQIEAYIKKTNKNTITLLELGAGTGQLSCNIMSIFQSYNKDTKITLNCIITDSNTELIKQLKTTYKNNPHITILCFNPVTDSYDRLPEFDIVIMSYLLDCFDTYHLEYKNNILKEKKIKSFISYNDYLITSKNKQLSYLDKQNLVNYINSISTNDSALKLGHFINEKQKSFKLKSTHPIFKSKIATRILEAEKQYGDHRFNLSLDVIESMATLFSHLNNTQMALIFDFGMPSSLIKSKVPFKYKATYTLCNFYSISFSQLYFLASQYNLNYLETQFKAGESQCILLHKFDSSDTLKQSFISSFSVPGNKKVSTCLSNIKRYISRHKNNSSVANYISKSVSKLCKYESQDYQFNIALCEIFIDQNLYSHAHKHLDLLISKHKFFARSAYFLKAKLFHLEKSPQKALSLIEKLDTNTLKHTGLLYQYCLALCKCEQYNKFEDVFIKFIQQTDYFIPWRFFIILHAIYSSQNQLLKIKQLTSFLQTLTQKPNIAINNDLKKLFTSISINKNVSH